MSLYLGTTPIADGASTAILSGKADKDDVYYKSGDNFIAGKIDSESSFDGIQASGMMTQNKTQILFSIFLPKRLTNISTITINSMIGEIRGADGGYIVALNTDFSTVGTLEMQKVSDNCITTRLTLNSASSQTNNIPVCVTIRYVSLGFS